MDRPPSETFWQFWRRKYSKPHYRRLLIVSCVLSAVVFCVVRVALWNLPGWLNFTLTCVITLVVDLAFYLRFDHYGDELEAERMKRSEERLAEYRRTRTFQSMSKGKNWLYDKSKTQGKDNSHE